MTLDESAQVEWPMNLTTPYFKWVYRKLGTEIPKAKLSGKNIEKIFRIHRAYANYTRGIDSKTP